MRSYVCIYVTGSENLDSPLVQGYRDSHLVASPYIPTHCPSSPYVFRHAASWWRMQVVLSADVRDCVAHMRRLRVPFTAIRAVVSDDPPRAAYDSNSSGGGRAAVATALAAGKRGLLGARAVAADGGDGFCGGHRRWERTREKQGWGVGRGGSRGHEDD